MLIIQYSSTVYKGLWQFGVFCPTASPKKPTSHFLYHSLAVLVRAQKCLQNGKGYALDFFTAQCHFVPRCAFSLTAAAIYSKHHGATFISILFIDNTRCWPCNRVKWLPTSFFSSDMDSSQRNFLQCYSPVMLCNAQSIATNEV